MIHPPRHAAGRTPVSANVILFLLFAILLSDTVPGQDADASSAGQFAFLNTEHPNKDAIGDDLPENAIMRFGTHRFQHPSSVNTMLLSPDDQVVVTLNSGVLIAWDAATGKEKWRSEWSEKVGRHITGPEYGQRFLCFSSDGKQLYSAARNQSIRTWDVETGKSDSVKMVIPKHPVLERSGSQLNSIDVSKDGKKMLVGGTHGYGLFQEDGTVEWYFSNVATEKARKLNENDRLACDNGFSTAIFSPDEKIVAGMMNQWPQRIQFINADSADEAGRIELDCRPVRMAFSPDGTSLFVTLRDCGIRAYSTATQKLQWEKKLEADPKGAESYTSAIECSPNGKHVAVGVPIGPKNDIYLLDAKTGTEQHILSTGWKPWAVQFSSDSQTLFSTGWNASIRRWNVVSGEELPLPTGIRASSCITQSRDGKTIAFVDGNGDVRLVNSTDGKQIKSISPEQISAGVLLFSPDAKTLHLAGAKDGKVGVESWDLETNKVVKACWPVGKDSHAGIEELATTGDGKLLAAASFRQDKVYIWNTSTSKQIAVLKHGDPYGLDFSPDGKTLATVGWDKKLRFWDPESGKNLLTIEMPKAIEGKPPGMFAGDAGLRMYGVRYSPTGEGMAIAHMDGLSLWPTPDLENPEGFKNLRFLAGRFKFGALDYSPDGKMIAAGDGGGDVGVYSVDNGTKVFGAGNHTTHVYTVRFASNKQLVSGGGGVCYLWKVSFGDF